MHMVMAMTFDRDRFHRKRIYLRRQNELEFMALVADQAPAVPLPPEEDAADYPPPLSVFDTESRPNLFATIAVDHNVIENPPPHASWVDNQTIPIIRTCVKCSWRGRPLTYDIGSGPEWACPDCECCQGALDQDLTPYKANLIFPESKAHE
jgi:hypothetical protein